MTDSIRVTAAELDGPVNVLGRSSFEITQRVLGTFQAQAQLSENAFGNAAAELEYSSAVREAVSALQSIAGSLDSLTKALASAASGYVVTDTNTAETIYGIPDSPLEAANPFNQGTPGVPQEYGIAPQNGPYTTTTYHIGMPTP